MNVIWPTVWNGFNIPALSCSQLLSFPTAGCVCVIIRFNRPPSLLIFRFCITVLYLENVKVGWDSVGLLSVTFCHKTGTLLGLGKLFGCTGTRIAFSRIWDCSSRGIFYI